MGNHWGNPVPRLKGWESDYNLHKRPYARIRLAESKREHRLSPDILNGSACGCHSCFIYTMTESQAV